jgi:hypothetical protein
LILLVILTISDEESSIGICVSDTKLMTGDALFFFIPNIVGVFQVYQELFHILKMLERLFLLMYLLNQRE